MKPFLSFTLCAVVVFLLSWLASPASAAPAAGASDYAQATRLLTAGKEFNEAITLLQSAVRAQPKNPDYHLALGCAYADQAAARLHGLKSTGKRATGATSEDIGEIVSLHTNAAKEWKAAVGLSVYPPVRAHAEYVRGEGILLLTAIFTPEADAGDPSMEEAIGALRSAVKDAPENATYWETLGAALFDIHYNSKEGIDDFRHSLALKPRKTSLWYVLFHAAGWRDREWDTGDLLQAERSDPNNALPLYLFAYLCAERTPLIQDGMNSSDTPSVSQLHPVFTREQCRLYLDRQMMKSLTAQDGRLFHEAMAALQKGNRKPSFALPDYHAPIPAMLQPAWRYSDRDDSVDLIGEIRELARAASGIVDVSAIEGHTAAANNEAEDIVTMGRKIRDYGGGLENHDPDLSIVNREVGQSIESIGYSSEACVATERSDPAALRLAHTKYDKSQQEGETLQQKLEAGLQSDSP